MKATYMHRGEALDYTNPTAEKIEANTVVLLGNHIGVAGGDIEPGQLGSLHVIGVFEIAKKEGVALEAGADVTYTDADGIDAAADAAVMGYVVKAAAADDKTAFVRIG